MTESPTTSEYSAGGVVYRPTASGYDIAVVNRARHTDWSLPKGHIEAGETREQAALREVKEETGLDAEIVRPLDEVVYFYNRPKKGLVRKTVYHYLMKAAPGELGKPNWEVDETRWVPITEAHELLTYKKDWEVVNKAQEVLGVRDRGSGVGD